MARLQGKTALVTGGAAGIGKGIATVFAAEGATVIISDVNESAGQQVVEEIRQKGGEGCFVLHDVSKEAQWEHVMETVVRQFGSLNVLVNNAGVTERGNCEDISFEDWKSVIDINLHGVFLGIKYGIQTIKKSGGGSIVNISSVEGLIGDPNLSAYTASKGGVRLLTKSAALLCARERYNIRVNSIHPGVIRTAIVSNHLAAAADPEAELQNLLSWVPLGVLGEPEDIAWGALYLASDEGRYLTGSELVIDGGWTAH